MKNIVNLGNVATYINGYAFKPSDWAEDGTPIIRIQDLTGNSYQMNRFKGIVDSKYDVNSGDVLISWSASLGVYVWNRGNAVLNQHIFKVVFDKEEVDKDFFVFQIDNLLKRAANQAHGATMRHLTKPVFDALPFYLPDIKTQRLISSKLNLIVHLIEDHHEQLKKLDELIRSRFIEMFGNVGEIDKHKVHDAFVTKLGDVANVKSSHRVFTSEFVESGIPFYRGTEIGELSNGQIPKHPFYITREHYEKLANDDSRPKIGDLLLPSICNNGQIWLVDTNKPFYYKDGRVLCISPYPDVFNSIYLLYYLKYRLTYEYPKLGSGSTFAEFKIFQLKNMDVLVPNIMKQNLFANFIHQVDKSKYREAIFLYLLEDIRICCNI